jgi:glutathione S-transferase
LWALEEVGAPYEYVEVDLTRGEGREPAFLEINPAGKVPVLDDGGLIISESAAICMHLSEQYPQSRLMPRPGTGDRAQCYKWISYVIAELDKWPAKRSFRRRNRSSDVSRRDAGSMSIEGVRAHALFAVANFLRFHPQIAPETVIKGPLYLIQILRVDQEDQTNFKGLGFIHINAGLMPRPRLTTSFYGAALVQ